MNAQQLAAWMHDEHVKVRELSDHLSALTLDVPHEEFESWSDEIRARFEHFRAHLYQHMALEENGGYLTPVIEMRPTLAADVERLRRDHQQMAEIMDTIHAALNDLNPQHRRSARECCYRIESLLSYVQHHERNENLLVTYVFTQDIGDHD